MSTTPGSGRSQQDLAAGALFVVLGAGGLWLSFSYSIGTGFNMGPGYFPALIFGTLVVVGLVSIGRGLAVSGPRLEPWDLRALLFVMAAVLTFAITVRLLGFALAAMALVLVATFAGAHLTLIQRLLLAVGVAAFSWAVFILGLGLVIPTWPEFLR